MEINRRQWLLGAAALGVVKPVFAGQAKPAFATSFKHGGSYYAALLDMDGQMLTSIPLPARAHDQAVSPDGRSLIVIARRPGMFALVIDIPTGRPIAEITVPRDRRLYGHGFFGPEGRYLYLTENDFDAERGVIGVYDVYANYQRVGEMDTQGTGPHQALLMSDGKTVAVANGGIATHPDFGRQKLNLADMAPNLSYLDLGSGAVLEQTRLDKDLHQLSLRHLCEDGQGRIWLGGQHQGNLTAEIPLVWVHERGQAPTAASCPTGTYDGFKHYIGSVVASADGKTIATSSPRGGQVLFWHAAQMRLAHRMSAEDVCGLAPLKDHFMATDGRGHVWSGTTVRTDHAVAWDNHIIAV